VKEQSQRDIQATASLCGFQGPRFYGPRGPRDLCPGIPFAANAQTREAGAELDFERRAS